MPNLEAIVFWRKANKCGAATRLVEALNKERKEENKIKLTLIS